MGLGALVALIGGCFGLAVAIKTLFFPPPVDPAKQFVTRAELASAVDGLDEKIDDLKRDLGGRVDRGIETINQVNLKMERLIALREAEAGIVRHPPQEPIITSK